MKLPAEYRPVQPRENQWTLEDLELLLGKVVRTEDPSMFNCGVSKNADGLALEKHREIHFMCCSVDDSYGGEGKVVEVRRTNCVLSVVVDWGYEWPVTASTSIYIKEESNGNG